MNRREALKIAAGSGLMSAAAIKKALAEPEPLKSGSVDVEAHNQRWQEPEDGIVFLSFRRGCDRLPTLCVRVNDSHKLYAVILENAKKAQPDRVIPECLAEYLGEYAAKEWCFSSMDVYQFSSDRRVCEAALECVKEF